MDDYTDFQNGLIMALANGSTVVAGGGADLPDVTEEDNGKVLEVVDGEWAAAEPVSGLPDVTEEDNGKTLSVIDGTWATDKQIIEVTKAEYDALGDTVKTDGKLYFIKDWTQPYAMNGKGMVSKVLWSGKQQTTGTITLNDSVDNYDLLLIRAGQDDANNWNTIIPKYLSYNDTNDKEEHGIISGSDRMIRYIFVDTTTISVTRVGAVNVNISKIIGLRFCAATCCYSTDEQIVGQWIDGKPIYQKTWIFDNVLVINSTKWYTTNISSNNMKIAINAFGISESGKFSYPLMTSLEVNSNYISLEACRDADSVGCKTLTIQYTKSTD